MRADEDGCELTDAQTLGEQVRAARTPRAGTGWLWPDKGVVQRQHGSGGVLAGYGDGERHVGVLLIGREHRYPRPPQDRQELRESLRRRRDTRANRGDEGHVLFTTDLGIDLSVVERRHHALLDP